MLPRLPPGMMTQSGTCGRVGRMVGSGCGWVGGQLRASEEKEQPASEAAAGFNSSSPIPCQQRVASSPHLPVELLQDLDGRRLLALQPQAVHRVGQVDGALRRHLRGEVRAQRCTAESTQARQATQQVGA